MGQLAYTRREDIVLATKLWAPVHEGPGGAGLSRKAVMEQIDASLRRLDTDFVDLYQFHRFDPQTPVEETMEALHDVPRYCYHGTFRMTVLWFLVLSARAKPRLVCERVFDFRD